MSFGKVGCANPFSYWNSLVLKFIYFFFPRNSCVLICLFV
uniref:Uncharacterized protein n=1 Tax=Arundo donax TaxID=35708 RepID=A0A0A9E5S6_ARUDO